MLSTSLKVAWIDELNRLVSFHKIDGARQFMDYERSFWPYILDLVVKGYLIQ